MGKSSNPADAQRRLDRKKEIKKNKARSPHALVLRTPAS